MIFARWLFRIAALWGFLILPPAYFHVPGDIVPNLPAYYYGFIGAALTMQLVYALISTDPARYRPLMLIGTIAKLSFVAPCLIAWRHGQIDSGTMVGASVDLLLAVLFLIAWWRTGKGVGFPARTTT